MAQGTPKVFLCHAKEDVAVAERLYEAMLAAGLDAWMDDRNLLAGDKWNRMIEDRVNDSDYFVAVHSHSLASKHFSYVNKEISLALERQRFARTGFRFIIPMLIDDAPLIADLKDVQAVATGADDFAALISVIKRDYQRRARASA
jgi:hypothetical protein